MSLNHYSEAMTAGADPAETLTAMRAAARDNARTPMQWDDSEHAGFTTGSPWMSVNPNYTDINADAEQADLASVYHYYRELIALRHREPAIVDGDFTMLLADHEQVYAFGRRHGATEQLVLANFASQPTTWSCPSRRAGSAPSWS